MKYLTFTIVLATILLLTACGWSDNQRSAARKAIDQGFSEGIEGSGGKVDPAVKEAWLDCVMEKVTAKWSFDEITKNPELMDEVQNECAKEVNLYDAVTVGTAIP